MPSEDIFSVTMPIPSAAALPVITNPITVRINEVCSMPGEAAILGEIADTVPVFVYKIMTVSLMPGLFNIIINSILILVPVSQPVLAVVP